MCMHVTKGCFRRLMAVCGRWFGNILLQRAPFVAESSAGQASCGECAAAMTAESTMTASGFLGYNKYLPKLPSSLSMTDSPAQGASVALIVRMINPIQAVALAVSMAEPRPRRPRSHCLWLAQRLFVLLPFCAASAPGRDQRFFFMAAARYIWYLRASCLACAPQLPRACGAGQRSSTGR